MKKTSFVICLVGFFFSCTTLFASSGKEDRGTNEPELRDSVLENILTNVSRYSGIVREYRAGMYVRGQYKVHKRNGLIRFVPSMFRFYKDVTDYLTEAVGEVHYTSPDVYDMKMRGLTGTFRRNKAALRNTLDYFNINVYSPTLLPDMLVSPLDVDGRRYYRYYLDSISGGGDSLKYHIRIIPKNKSTQLVGGRMVVNGGRWTIHEITLQGRLELVDFSIHMLMGNRGGETFLPVRLDAHLMFSFMWNKIEADYSAAMTYEDIRLRDGDDGEGEEEEPLPEGRDKYDLTNSYLLKCDNSEMVSDTSFMASVRPFPLTKPQQKIYADYNARRRKVEDSIPEPKRKTLDFWWDVGDALVSSYTLNFGSMGSVRCSPLVNPVMMSYSHSNGFSYSQKLKYSLLFPNDRWLRITPKLGYNFTRKEFYWNADMEFYYDPLRLGALTLEVGNGNRIYTSRVMEEIRELKDTLIDFSKLHLEYFTNNYVQVGNRIELDNGLELFTSLAMHWRKAEKASQLPDLDAGGDRRMAMVNLRPTYTSFAPRVRLKWTPGQYYYMNGRRKINLHSSYPTLSVDYERGIKGVLGSNGSYERIETDIQQRIRLTPMSYLSYRLGGGLFTDQQTVYFVDFANFTRSNLPTGWNDDIGGVFQLLDGEWYNSSRWYTRGHITYEAPFLIIPHLRKYTRVVYSERIYLSTLYTTHLNPYIEVGYGIGTHIFDFGLFVNNINGSFGEVGCKFTFELFNR